MIPAVSIEVPYLSEICEHFGDITKILELIKRKGLFDSFPDFVEFLTFLEKETQITKLSHYSTVNDSTVTFAKQLQDWYSSLYNAHVGIKYVYSDEADFKKYKKVYSKFSLKKGSLYSSEKPKLMLEVYQILTKHKNKFLDKFLDLYERTYW